LSGLIEKDMQNEEEELLDQEWVDLIVEAFKIGLTALEVREFLKNIKLQNEKDIF
jgi:hypothetical protein